MPLNRLVIQVIEPGDHDCWAIERSVVFVCSCSGVVGGTGSVKVHLDIEEESTAIISRLILSDTDAGQTKLCLSVHRPH